MPPSESVVLHIVHLVAILLLTGLTFAAFAAPPETRKRVLIGTGVASLLVLATGVRLWQGMYHFAPMGWIYVKGVCWLLFSALAGLGYRRRHLAPVLLVAGAILLTIAVIMVYAKPF